MGLHLITIRHSFADNNTNIPLSFHFQKTKMKKEKAKQDSESGGGHRKGNNNGIRPIHHHFNLNSPLPAKIMDPQPNFIDNRIQMWDKLMAQYKSELEAKPKTQIKVTLPDGKEVEATAWTTSPYDIASGISKGLADNCVISKVNGELWDLDRPLEGDCKLHLLKFDDPEAQAVFWHSSAHILGEAMERVYGGHLCYGPPIENGFYYDMHIDGEGVSGLLS